MISPATTHRDRHCWLGLRFALISMCLVLAGSRLFAQTYDLRRYAEESGLEDNYVYSIVQDPKGFLYVGTGGGLFRFDGANFKRLSTNSGLAADFTTASFLDRDGRVWLGHYEGQVSVLNGLRVRPLQDSNMVHALIVGFAQDQRGRMWGASQKGLFSLDTTGVQAIIMQGLEGRRVLSMALAKEGGVEYLLVGTGDGLLVYEVQAKGLEFKYASTKVPETMVQSIAYLPRRHSFVLGTQDMGIVEFRPARTDSGSSVAIYNAETGHPYLENIQTLYVDANKDLWAGTASHGFLKITESADQAIMQVLPATASDTSGSDNVRAIYQDKFGQVWIGTYGNGLTCLSEKMFMSFRLKADTTGRLEVYCTIEDQTGDYWLGTNRGIYVVDRREVANSGGHYSLGRLLSLGAERHYGIADGLPSEEVTSLAQDANQNIFAGTRSQGVAVLRTATTRFEPIALSDLGGAKNINGITPSRDGMVWIATTDGAYAYDVNTSVANYYGTQNKLPHNNIYNIYCDRKGQLWFSTHTDCIAKFDGKGFERYFVREKDEVPLITCVAEGKDGTFWIGSEGAGLYHYDGKAFKRFTQLDGLQSNYIYHLVVDHYGNVWATHRDGVSRYIVDTDHILAYPAKSFIPREENPIHDVEIDAYGNIWISSEYGLIRYNWYPARNKTAAPFIHINGVQVGDSLWPMDSPIDLSYGAYTIKFDFLGLTFLNQKDVLYQCKLEGRESEWSAPTQQSFMTYQGLEDGEYTFHVRARNVFGRWNESAAKITFRIAAPFWKTWWFRILVVLAIAGLVYSYIRYRFYRLKREKTILEEKVRRRTVELQAEKEKVLAANAELQKLSLVASETDNAIFILDAHGTLIWVNPGLCRLTGYTAEEIFAMRNGGTDFLATSTNREVKSRLEQAISLNGSVQYESELPSKSGTPIYVVSTLTPILNEDGSLRNIVIIDSDITERKLAEEKIRQMNAELESQVAARTRELAEANASLQRENEDHIKTAERLRVINSELDTFVYRASHDLKGPLASLNGLINIANMELAGNETAGRYLGLMDKAAKRLDNILVDLIEATQVKQRKVELLEIEALPLAQGIAESVKQLHDMTNAELILDIAPDLKLTTDETLITAILQNFLANALKYRDSSKPTATAKLSIGRTAEGNRIRIAVEDNGIGISEEMKPKVFDMFFRGSHTMGGSGLGLYIVKQAAEKLGGTVALESTLGVGTTLIAYLPA